MQRRYRVDGYLGCARTASSAFTLLVFVTLVASFSDMIKFGYMLRHRYLSFAALSAMETTLIEVSHCRRQLCKFQTERRLRLRS
jgi:hypothetical protein